MEKIPASVRCLTLYKDVDDDYENCFAKDFTKIPQTVTHLKLNRITVWKKLQAKKFPSTIQRLSVNSAFEEVGTVPPSIKELRVDPNLSNIPKTKTSGIKMKRIHQIDSDDEEEKEPSVFRTFTTKIVNSYDKQK